jgi:uncharacterized integral membrane protein (TIGR00697 family)
MFRSQAEKLDVLLAVYIGAIVSAELLGSKAFSLGWLNSSVAIFVFPLTYTINDIVYEVYGKQRAHNFMRSGFVVLGLLSVYTLLALVLPPATRFAATEPAYDEVFGKSLRIIIASLTAFWISQRFDILVFSKLREKLGQKSLWFRNNASNILSQFVDTAIFMFLAFYVPGNFWFVWSLVIPYWLLKSTFSFFGTPVTYMGVRWLKQA